MWKLLGKLLMRLGKTNLIVNKNGFGGLPIQRRNVEDSIRILRKAYNNGINFYDTGRYYADSEEKIGLALSDVRENIYIASKTMAQTAEEFWNDLETSLKNLQTDYIDLYQFHNPPFCPKADDDIYQAMVEAKDKGIVNHIGISSHKYTIANEAIESGLFETLQFPFSYLTDDKELELVRKCEIKDIGFIAMKGMAGGLIRNSKASYCFMQQFDNVLPIWGIQRESELDEFISYQNSNLSLNNQLIAEINNDKEELQGDFCRGCGYCMPCPKDIKINTVIRTSLGIRRFSMKYYLIPEYEQKMERINDCTECMQCVKKCPYELDIPHLLRENYEDYKNILSGKTIIK